MTILKPCTCQHEYQDRRYGRGLRVHNATKGPARSGAPGWRCTVCGLEKT